MKIQSLQQELEKYKTKSLKLIKPVSVKLLRPTAKAVDQIYQQQ